VGIAVTFSTARAGVVAAHATVGPRAAENAQTPAVLGQKGEPKAATADLKGDLESKARLGADPLRLQDVPSARPPTGDRRGDREPKGPPRTRLQLAHPSSDAPVPRRLVALVLERRPASGTAVPSPDSPWEPIRHHRACVRLLRDLSPAQRIERCC